MEGIEEKFVRFTETDEQFETDFGLDKKDSDGFFFGRDASAEERLLTFPRQPEHTKVGQFERVEFIGLTFDQANFDGALNSILSQVGSREFGFVVTPNVDHVMTITRSKIGSDVRTAYDAADFMFCDSRILSLMCKKSGIALEAVPGSDITGALLSRLSPDTRIAVVGGKLSCHRQLLEMYPQFQWNFMTPPMGVRNSVEHQDAICDFVIGSAADITFVAIGAPQSEIVCQRLKERGGARGLALCIGASLEFITGEKRRAPKWMQKAHCEWLFRLLCEPHRLAHRYLVKGPGIFVQWRRWLKRRAAQSA